MKTCKKSHLLVVVVALLQGCVSLLPPNNKPITTINNDKGYRVFNADRKPIGDHQVVLAFSGGGTRAAALSYGVLQELRDTRIDASAAPVRLLDEVDLISSVSGGSFTAAYYGLYGDALFQNYENDFLRKSVQSSLIDNLLSPSYWYHAMFSGINRTDMAVDYYNRTIFHDATFADIPLAKRPFIEINATDLSTGSHVSFAQGYFDMFCTDLSSFPVARAVTASSGVPMAFPPVTIKNHAGECDIKDSSLAPLLDKTSYDNAQQEELIKTFNSYLDAEKRPYIHLVDGGVADNLGLRAVLDRHSLMNSNLELWLKKNPVRDVLVILVNAEVKPEKPLDKTYQAPSMIQTAGALSDALISRYTVETRALVKNQMQNFEEQMHAAGHDVHFYFVEVDFASLDSPGLQRYFNSLPTSLELSNDEIDVLIAAGHQLLRQSDPYRAFLARNNGVQEPTPKAREACSMLKPINCLFD